MLLFGKTAGPKGWVLTARFLCFPSELKIVTEPLEVGDTQQKSTRSGQARKVDVPDAIKLRRA